MNPEELAAENRELRARLAETEKKLEAVRGGGGAALLNAELKVKEERFRMLFDASPDGVFALDATGRFVLANPACEKISGYPVPELLQKTFRDLCAPDQLATAVAYFERGLREGIHQEFEIAVLRKDGRRAELWVVGELVTLGGQPVLQCTVKDITERKQVEEALRKNQSLLQAVIETASDPIYAKDARGRLVLINPAGLKSVGKPLEQILGHEDREFYDDPAVSAAIRENDRRVMTRGTAESFEEKLITPEGYRDYLDTKAPWRDAQGNVIGIVGVSRDITDRKRAEAALRDSEERFRVLADAGFEGVVIAEDGIVVEANRQFAAIHGYELPEVIGQPITRFLHPDEQARVAAVVASAGEARGEYRCVRKNGSEIIVEAQGQTTTWRGRQARLVVLSDITVRKRTEAALREKETHAQVTEAVQAEQKRLREVLNLLPAYVVLLSPDYRVPFANRFFEERFGKSEGRRCYEYLFNRTAPCENCQTYNVLKTNTPQRWEWTGPDGRNYEIHDFPFRDVDSSPLIMEVGLDITERKQAEAELARYHKHLEQLVTQRTAELTATNQELVRFNEAMAGRELRMAELKQEINALCQAQGQPPRYATEPELQAFNRPPEPQMDTDGHR